MNDLRETYLSRTNSHLAAAVLLALDLMRGDPATLKAGYTAENAALAATDVFPEVESSEILEALR
jgi:hypothetical protein